MHRICKRIFLLWIIIKNVFSSSEIVQGENVTVAMKLEAIFDDP